MERYTTMTMDDIEDELRRIMHAIQEADADGDFVRASRLEAEYRRVWAAAWDGF